jgi:acetylornithine deacetylase/succinyl-diaminopimelate desuccinylase-like protein
VTDETLATRTLELVDIPSESRDEAEIERYVASVVPRQPAYAADSVLFYPPPQDGPFVLLVGHLDTVPAQGNIPGRIEGGAVHGLGASDMKGGVAVMVELARDPALDAGFLFFGREELPADESPLAGFFAACPRALEAALAVVLEPTDNTIQAGCLGNLNARLAFRGRSAHSARPWLGENAIAAAVRGLAAGIEVEVESNSPPARVVARAPLVDRLRAAGGFELEPKQAWTPVAEFSRRGIDAVNLGPGATRYAHARDEQVEIAELARTYQALSRFLATV